MNSFLCMILNKNGAVMWANRVLTISTIRVQAATRIASSKTNFYHRHHSISRLQEKALYWNKHFFRHGTELIWVTQFLKRVSMLLKSCLIRRFQPYAKAVIFLHSVAISAKLSLIGTAWKTLHRFLQNKKASQRCRVVVPARESSRNRQISSSLSRVAGVQASGAIRKNKS